MLRSTAIGELLTDVREAGPTCPTIISTLVRNGRGKYRLNDEALRNYWIAGGKQIRGRHIGSQGGAPALFARTGRAVCDETQR